MSNVNNLNGVPNFGHGEEEMAAAIPTVQETPALDDTSIPVETEASAPKIHKSKVKSAAQKTFGGLYQK